MYGLRAQGLSADQLPHDRIEAMAQRYLREIRGCNRTVPYLLAGWSMGGLIALEIAAAQAAGEHVDWLPCSTPYLWAEEFSVEDMDENSVMRWIAHRTWTFRLPT